MVGIILASHGDFANGILQSSSMIFGEQENVKAVTLMPSEGPDDIRAKIESAIASFENVEEILFLVDLWGGTPFNQTNSLFEEHKDKWAIVTGMNLPMVIEAFGARFSMESAHEIAASILNSSREGIKVKPENLEVVEEIVGEAIHRVKRFSNKRKIIVELPDEVIMVNVDGLLIEQVIMNLIDNAIRHTPENLEIKVKVSKVENYIQFEVEDQGSGLKEEDLPHIFKRFYTKSKGKSLEKRGIGLGLAICNSIVEAHKGDIKAFNNKMGGATFRFKIPYMKE